MRKRNLANMGKRTLVALLAVCMSVMMVPATAFAVGEDAAQVDEQEEAYFEADNQASYLSEGERGEESFQVNVEAKAGETKSATESSVTAENGGVQAKANGNDSQATATINGTVTAGETGVSVYARYGTATVEAGDVTADNAGQFGAVVTSWYETATATANLGNVVAGAGIRADANYKGTLNLETGDVKVTKGDAENFNANSISTSGGGKANVKIGDVTSAASGLVLSARRDGRTTVEAGTITAEGSGLLVTNSGGAVVASLKDINAKDDALSIRNTSGGQSSIVVDGRAVSAEENGLVYVNLGNAESSDAVLVTDTISGATNGVVIYPSTAKLDLTVWKIEAGTGDIIKGDETGAFAQSVNYIVQVEQPEEGATVTALKADGSALDKKYADNGQGGYEVANEGDKVILKVDVQSGYQLTGAYNGKGEMVALLQDENGNYYVIVPQGGGIYLSVVLDGGIRDDFTVVPDPTTIVTTATVGDSAATSNDAGASSTANDAGSNATASDEAYPLLTVDGVEINKVKLEMKGQVPNLRLTLSNTNGRDVEFDCTKFKVVNVDDDKEIPFKTKAKELKAIESSVEVEFAAEANAMKAGDRAYVYYDNQLLGTFTVA